MATRQFSDVTLALSQHMASLKAANAIFEEDLGGFNELLLEHLEEVASRNSSRAAQKTRWQSAEDWSTAKKGGWARFTAGSRIRLDVKQPGYKRFTTEAAWLYFQVLFDEASAQFIFRARFQNQNKVHKDFDERVFDVVKQAGSEVFPNHEQVKKTTTVLFRFPLESSLFDQIVELVDRAVDGCEKAVDLVYPDDLYVGDRESMERGDAIG